MWRGCAGGARRNAEGSELHQKDEKTTQRAWGWDLHEMREAAMMDRPMLDEPSDDPHPTSTVSGFTPVNHRAYIDATPVDLEHDNAATESKAANKPRASKRRKTQPSAATKASKPKKPASSRKTKRAKTAAQLDCQDISQSLPRTKPTSSEDGALCTKASLSFGDFPLAQKPEPQKLSDRRLEYGSKPAFSGSENQNEPLGLADKYQAAFTNSRRNVINIATPPTPPKSDDIEADLDHDGHTYDHVSATERQASPKSYSEPSIKKSLESDDSIVVRDFGAPPFTQASPPLQETNFEAPMIVDEIGPQDSISDGLFELRNIRYGDYDGEDDFPMDDECFDEMVQSMAVLTEGEPLGSDWRPQDFSDDTLYIGEQPEDEEPHWPGAIPDSDEVVIYDEGPTLVASDVIDVPSSPQWNSQSSCILTHVTGNADPCRVGTLEGSENCFDDNELDDGLINFVVDESESPHVTSPVTPAKRPLSPRLQWLPPNTHTPGKSSQIPVSRTHEPHVVEGEILPFIRPPFPKAVRDRSPILGLSNRTVLRICFRIGEALNAAAVASRTNVDAIIELYARVVSSSREASGGYKQFFQFGDLFTDKPPYLSGTYSFWKGVAVWDIDSKELVGERGRGKMVRVLGRIKKKEPGQGHGPGVEMVVLSIWEVDWEDVGVAKGIACPKES